MLKERLAKEWYTWPSAPGQGDRLQQRAPRSSQAWRSFDAPRWGQNGVLDLYATKLVSIRVHSYAKCIYRDVAFCRYWWNSAACGVGRVADVDE